MKVRASRGGKGPGARAAGILLALLTAAALAVRATELLLPDAPLEESTVLDNTGLTPATLAVIVNDQDPMSVKVAEYYVERRRIPPENVIHLSFTPPGATLQPPIFKALYKEVQDATPPDVQAYAITWTLPYRVGCMSITTAFAAGYDEAFCAQGCKPTRPSPYYDSSSKAPYDDFGWRPAMSLAGRSFDEVKALIDRGVAADRTFPVGTAYLATTKDKARNTRAPFYPRIRAQMSNRFVIEQVEGPLEGRKDVMFYFIGMQGVPKIETNRYLPGAIADHLTSAGGILDGTGPQMSVLRWLEAGATGSYGAVVEPCNYPQKFPHPGIVMDRYLRGETLIEAYWKSVAWPGQGIFVGEPLAAPFRF